MTTNRELPILLGIITCTGASWAAHAVGISPSLGAFIAGVLLAETSFEEQIRSDLAGLKAVFGTLFFTSVGMLVDVKWIAGNWWWVLLATAVILVGKSLGNFVAIRAWKRTTKSSVAAALTLSQIGELGFILLQIGTVSGLLSMHISQMLTASAVLTMVLSPLIIGNAQKLAQSLANRILPSPRIDQEEREDRVAHMTHHFIVVGFGTSGRTVARILCEAQYTVVAVDIDPKFVKQAAEMDVAAIVGDATQVDLLADLCLNDARALIVALPDHRSAVLAIAHARRLAPNLVIVARARYHQFQDELRTAGATLIIGEEELLGRRLGEEAVRIAIGKEDEDVREAV
jgi:CPA2 family monovalent cation:H+ antiporter-2